jgi:Zn-dependent peptidase ImmA (M78 family)
MDNDLEVELAGKPKLAAARHAATALLKAAKATEAPIKISQLVPFAPKRFNLVIAGSTDLPSTVDAFTRSEAGITIIGYNKNVPPVRQKFSVAHELGHLYLGHLHGQSSIDLNSGNCDEIEANQFAAHLIMPTAMLRKDINAGVKDAKELAKRYLVSEDAMWWQLSKSGLINIM